MGFFIFKIPIFGKVIRVITLQPIPTEVRIMTIFNIISLLGGLALFLFGMNTMSSNLEKTAGGKLEKILKVMTHQGTASRHGYNRNNSVVLGCYGYARRSC